MYDWWNVTNVHFLKKVMAVIRSVRKRWIVTLMQNVMYKVSAIPSAIPCGTLLAVAYLLKFELVR